MFRLITTAALSVLALGAQTTPGVMTASAQVAERPEMRAIPDPAAPPRVGVGVTQRKLTLDETIQMALENNLDIDIERTNRDTAAQSLFAARGFFDPAFRWTPLLTSDNVPVASVLQGAGGKLATRGFTNNFAFRQKFPQWGTV